METDPALLLNPDHLPGIELSPLGAKVTGAIDEDAIVSHLLVARDVATVWRWMIGDLVWALTTAHDGDLAYAWQLVADEDLDSRSSLSRSVAVARMVPFERRRPGLSWSHHEAVLAAGTSHPIEEGDDRDLLLARAEAEQWRVGQLERYISEARSPTRSHELWDVTSVRLDLNSGLGAHPVVMVRADGTVVAAERLRI